MNGSAEPLPPLDVPGTIGAVCAVCVIGACVSTGGACGSSGSSVPPSPVPVMMRPNAAALACSPSTRASSSLAGFGREGWRSLSSATRAAALSETALSMVLPVTVTLEGATSLSGGAPGLPGVVTSI